MSNSQRSPWLLVPPPPLFVVAFLAGVGLTRLVPIEVVPPSLLGATRAIGIALIVAAALLVVVAPALFLRHHTTIVPFGQARRLVITGPYRITRNPMYLGLAIAYVGVAFLMHLLWPLLFLVLPLAVLQLRVIPFEEANLARSFGDEYLGYQNRVRRWI